MDRPSPQPDKTLEILEILKNTAIDIETLLENIPTRRDLFIAAALSGLVANPGRRNGGEEGLIEAAIRLADLTVEHRNREELHY